MSEQPERTPRFVTCFCQYCNGGIEFDASTFETGETRAVECPHCNTETIIFVPEQEEIQPVAPLEQTINESVKLIPHIGFKCEICDQRIEFNNVRPGDGVACPHCTCTQIIPENNLESVGDVGGVSPVISDKASLEREEKLISPSPDNSGQVDEKKLQHSINNAQSFTKDQTADAKWQFDLGIANTRQKEYIEAVKCFTYAAKQGHAEAQSLLGISYKDGLGVGKNEAEAVKWFLMAAEQGQALAEFHLAVAYNSGRGIPKDLSAALKWLHKAAEHGNDDAQFMLGICYETGEGVVAANYVEAYKWMKLAAAQRHEVAREKCQEIVLKMNAEQIAKVEPHHQMLWKRERLTLKRFYDFIGQNRIKARLELAIGAAKQRGESLNHILLIGSPGSGKATLARIIARVLGANIKVTSGATINKSSDLCGLLTNLEEGDVLFIDEVHRLRKSIEEHLYPATKDFKLDIIIDQGPDAREVRLNLPRFTLIGSTTTKERLTPNLLSCFRIIENLDDYSMDELAAIGRRFATAIEIEIEMDATDRIARSADGTPIDVLNRLQHVSDFAHVNGNGKITLEVAEAALKMLESSEEKQYVSDSRDAIPSAVRREVWRRDGGKCARCGSRKNLEYDHIIPVSKGGSNTARNIELLCETCNRAKSDLIQ